MTSDATFPPPAPDLGVCEVVHHAVVTSTMDVAHALAREGAPGGTLVVADAQSEGRGRAGKRWHSATGDGLWCTLIERPSDASGLSVLSLRLGMSLATSLAPVAGGDIRVKWPNDLYVRAKKLAGILVEARWREGALDWVAIGIGINLRAGGELSDVATLNSQTTRSDVLRRIMPSLRRASAMAGPLTPDERASWLASDLTIGRQISAPVEGTVRGLAVDGSLQVETTSHDIVSIHAGSLEFTNALDA